jgi:peptide-methionine (R)-S-oxide reductase
MNYKELAKQKLSEEEYDVLINKGTERPFSSKFDLFFENGEYFCKLCGSKLFSSEYKFDSRCGWPSFSEAENVELKQDNSHNMSRTEVICKTCRGHLGHLFADGPPPQGRRFCINGVCLTFKKL